MPMHRETRSRGQPGVQCSAWVGIFLHSLLMGRDLKITRRLVWAGSILAVVCTLCAAQHARPNRAQHPPAQAIPAAAFTADLPCVFTISEMTPGSDFMLGSIPSHDEWAPYLSIGGGLTSGSERSFSWRGCGTTILVARQVGHPFPERLHLLTYFSSPHGEPRQAEVAIHESSTIELRRSQGRQTVSIDDRIVFTAPD